MHFPDGSWFVQMNPLESVDANLAIWLGLKATKGVEIVTDDHGAGVCPVFAHLRHLGPFSFVNIKLANSICGLTVRQIATHNINEALVVVASKAGASLRNLLASPHRIVLQIPLLHFVGDFISDFV